MEGEVLGGALGWNEGSSNHKDCGLEWLLLNT